MQEKIKWYENKIRGRVNEKTVILLKNLQIILLIIIIILFLLSPITKLFVANIFLMIILTFAHIKYSTLKNLLYNSPVKVGISKKGIYLEYQTEDIFVSWDKIVNLHPLTGTKAWEMKVRGGKVFTLMDTEQEIKEQMHHAYLDYKTDKRKKK